MPLEPARTSGRTHCRRETKRPGAWAGNDLGDLGCGGVLEGMRDYGGYGEWPGGALRGREKITRRVRG